MFLPPNMTSKLKPMDQGDIRSLKARIICSWLIEAIDKNKPIPTFSILDAMKMLDMAWEIIPKQVIVNCFSKAGISEDKQEAAIRVDDYPFSSR